MTRATLDAIVTSDLAALAEALAKAQGRIANAAKNADNPVFASSYADLASVWEACRGPLSDNGLSVVQLPVTDGPLVGVTTILLHASGQWMRSTMWMQPERSDPQAVGSVLSYLRRYSLAAVVGVAQRDDDAGAATLPRANTVKADGSRATYDQLALIEALREKAGVSLCSHGFAGPCPWPTKKWSKSRGGLVDKEARCAFHADVAAFKLEDGTPCLSPHALSYEQAETLIERYRRSGEKKEKRATEGMDLGAMGWPADELAAVRRAQEQSDLSEAELCSFFGVDTISELPPGSAADAFALLSDYGTDRFELAVARLRDRQKGAQ